MMLEARKQTEKLLEWIRKSPTAFHAAQTMGSILEENGFERLEEADHWRLRAGGKYFVTRNLSSLIAFCVPKQSASQILIAAGHTDSPMFKLKNNYESVAFDRYLKLDTEVYGGTILSSWLDRPLSVSGRLIVRQGDVFSAKLVRVDRDLLLIPNVAIHMNRDANNGYAFNPATDLVPLFGGENAKGRLKNMLADEAGCAPEEIVGHDLFVYNRMPGSIWGADDEFFSSPRIDDLMCAFGTLSGFCAATPREDSLNICFNADNEETGSETKQGAGSSFLRDVIDRVCEAIGADSRRLLASGFMVSADNGHARHPNRPELCDPLNAPHLNQGVVIKSNAAQHYATDGLSAAIFTEICTRAGVPVQQFANRSDMRGGSTLGSISNTKVPLRTVDIGMAQLAMHSAYETAGTADFAYLTNAMRLFYSVGFQSATDRDVRLIF